MTPPVLLIAFFLFTLAAVSAAGYAFVLKPSRGDGENGPAALPVALDHPDLPAAQAAAMDVFRMMGEALPSWAARTSDLRRELATGCCGPSCRIAADGGSQRGLRGTCCSNLKQMHARGHIVWRAFPGSVPPTGLRS